MDDQVTYWEGVAKTSWGNYTSCIERQAIIEASPLVNGQARILDFGCEGGRWSILLSSMGWTNIVCADANLDVLRICQKRLPTAMCVCTDSGASVMPFKTGSFGFLLCIEVFPVIHSGWFIDEAFRILRSGGLLIGVIHNRFSYRAIINRCLCALNLRKKTNGYYNVVYSRWRKKLVQRDFKVTYERGFCWLPFPRSSNCRFIPQLLQIEERLRLSKIPRLSPWVIFVAQKL
jgi:SAM-dependent methyltransferase